MSLTSVTASLERTWSLWKTTTLCSPSVDLIVGRMVSGLKPNVPIIDTISFPDLRYDIELFRIF